MVGASSEAKVPTVPPRWAIFQERTSPQRGRGDDQGADPSGEQPLVRRGATYIDHDADNDTRFELSTDSRTGALGLYEKVGMRVTSTWVNRAVDSDQRISAMSAAARSAPSCSTGR